MRITNLKTAVINEQFFKAMRELKLSFEVLLINCSNQSLEQYVEYYPELIRYSEYSGELDFLLTGNVRKINFAQLKRARYKFLNPFFTKHQQECISNRDFCLKFIECIQLSRGHFDVLFEVYPFLDKLSILQVEEADRDFYHHFWTAVLKNQNLSVFDINRFYGHCLQNKQYAVLLTSAKNQFWKCDLRVIGAVLQSRNRAC